MTVDFSASASAQIPDLAGRTINDGRLILRKVVGRGAWGVVYLAEATHDSQGDDVAPRGPVRKFAVKVVCNRDVSAKHHRAISREVGLHNVCAQASPGVLKLHYVVEDAHEGLLFIVTDFCEGGDLLDAILAGRFVGQHALTRSIFVQILDAVEACHDLGVFHRDIKPENILCRDGGTRIALADFGFATCEKLSTDFCMGSEPFMSPEVRGGLRKPLRRFSTPAADVWALGVVLMNLACGCLPWAKASLSDPGFRAYLAREVDFLPRYFPITRALGDVLRCVFTADPSKRIGIPELRRRVGKLERFGLAEAPLAVVPSVERSLCARVSGGIGMGGGRAGVEVLVTHEVVEQGEDEEGIREIIEMDLADMHIEDGIVEVRVTHIADTTTPKPLASYLDADMPLRRRTPSSASSIIGALHIDSPTSPLGIMRSTSGVSTFINFDARFGSAANAGPDALPLAASSSDASSVAESEGPITPPQFAADAAIAVAVVSTPHAALGVVLEEVPDLELEERLGTGNQKRGRSGKAPGVKMLRNAVRRVSMVIGMKQSSWR